VIARRYPPELFSSEDLEQAVVVAEQVKFASIHPVDGTLCDPVFAPFVSVHGAPQVVFQGHLVRSNPLFELLMDGPLNCRLIFQAADGYVSPSVYEETPRSGKVVPTWNYVAAQFFGPLEKVPDDHLLPLLENQVDEFERCQSSDWRLSDAPPDYIDQMSRAVFGIQFEPKRWSTHHKLSQNRPTDRQAVIAWTKALDTPFKTLAYWMGEPDDG
jgi:transcriptional regulator